MTSDPSKALARNFIDGRWSDAGTPFDVVAPYNGQVVSRALEASSAMVDEAVEAAARAKAAMAAMPGYERAAVLRRVQAAILERLEEIAVAITRETGKVLRDTREEVRRASETIGLCAEEAIRIRGDHLPLDGSAAGAGKLAMMLRFPVGVVGAIVPFNAPFNLSCHKLGPAFAAGNAVVMKSAPEAPTCARLAIELFAEAGAPAGAMNLLHGRTAVGEALVRNPKVNFITFTGSSRGGAAVRQAAGMRRVLLELGGLGPNIVHADADLERAAKMTALHGTRLAGQSCISVQNLFVHRSVLGRFLDLHVPVVREMVLGDPLDAKTDVGPVINEAAAERIEAWLREAEAAGAKILCGGKRRGAFVEPTVITDVTDSMKVVCQEIFGPVIVVRAYDDFDEPIRWINSTEFGLNCGVFTASIATAFEAIRRIECGGVIINGTSTFRPDQVPYGGIKNSGLGREGPHHAILEMTEQKLVVFSN
ncbi:aldehyde dehydrogenase family protein [Variovorax sp. PBL-E5]|uniref:aldehyde dehydrogenase family protein n=1 Tax=Variovorax sp. PBL-E5 TaxID=434014 RepID=UPI00131710E8|nr:aldehyde dehydrogenase family protein [Variovorax sp. PBL-E5]VTU16795.1 Sulfoacetaldehyde dehydrogenase [Variovorax sp. PBL-E5]